MNPWKTLSSSQIYTNPWFSVREDQVIAPDGRPDIYHVVSARRLAVGIVPVWQDGSVTLVGQYRYPIQEYSWEIPEGGGDFNVEPLESAKRELREETGITADTWEYLGRTHTSNCFLDEVGHLFVATNLRQGMADPSPEEILRVRRVPFHEAVVMVKDGHITDAISIAAIFHLLSRFTSITPYGPDQQPFSTEVNR
ncbi:MAG TPA: NUDIX domain-containing protein [Nitrospiraceae bacterium]|jgi:8-oxo-dGTP pyrophosphatase MutT (NUDIX family)|nr:NUDIX domain-containing protein [Nitrospiraceae bacterium]